MSSTSVFNMQFSNVFPLLLAKAERKGRTREEVYQVTAWLTGYTFADLERFLTASIPYGEFFRRAPCMNEHRHLIRGSICGVKLESIEDPLMQDIRYLDKLVDELAKGKPMEKILRGAK